MNQVKFLSAAALSVLVAACGGGGGGGDVSVPVPAPVPAAAPGTLVTTVAAPSYAVASEELSAFNTLNAERERCGFGKLAQNAQLDLAARDHSLWRLTNNVVGHVQDPVAQPNGYTGRTPDERAVFRGYAAAQVRETINVRLPVPKAGMGAVLTRGLLAAPYHALALLDGYRDVGTSVLSDVDAGSTAVTGQYVSVQFDVGYKNAVGAQLLAADAVATYPCEGSTGVNYALFGESPNPVPGRDLSTSPVGHPVIIKVRDGNVLAVQSVQIVNAATGAAVPVRPVVNRASDTTGQIVTSSVAFVLPDVALAAATSYRVTVSGTNSTVPFSKVFTFTTGAVL